MEIVLVAVAAGMGAYVLWPALTGVGPRWEISEDDTPEGRLAVRKEVLVGNLADLDFEFAMGKMSEEDYRSIRESLKRQTLKVMEQIEVLEQSERAVSGDRPAESGSSRSAAFCSSCGSSLPGKARFCPDCGSKVG